MKYAIKRQWEMVLLSVLLTPAANLFAAEDPGLSISLGGFITERDTTTRLDSASTPGFDTDFEDDLGLDSSDSVFRLDSYYRFNPSHQIDFSVFDLSRSATNRLQGDISWGGDLYSVDTLVKTDFDLTIYKLAYTYSLWEGDTGYIGVTGGIHVSDFDITLVDEAQSQSNRGDVTAPLPVLGLRGAYHLSDNWTARASGEFFAIELDNNFSGSLSDLYLGLDYQLFDNVGVGVGFNVVSMTDSSG